MKKIRAAVVGYGNIGKSVTATLVSMHLRPWKQPQISK